MKRITKSLLITLLILFIFGCETKNNIIIEKMNEYIGMLSVNQEITGDFYLPRELNGEGDHIITWSSSNEELVSIGNIIRITGIHHYLVDVNLGDKDYEILLKAKIEMKDGSFTEKDFNVTVKEDLSIKEAKITYIKDMLSIYRDLVVKESIVLPVVSKEYGFEIIWTSSNSNIINSRGEYNAPEQETIVDLLAVVMESGEELYREVFQVVAISKNTIEKEIMLDFVTYFSNFAQNWDSSYIERVVENDELGIDVDLKVVFSRADKQSGTIVDRPVTATKASTEYITISLNDKSMKEVEFSLTQWSTKTFDSIYIEYYNGNYWIQCGDTQTVPSKISADFSGIETKSVRLAFSSKTNKNVQMGLEYIKIEIN